MEGFGPLAAPNEQSASLAHPSPSPGEKRHARSPAAPPAPGSADDKGPSALLPTFAYYSAYMHFKEAQYLDTGNQTAAER